MTDKALGTLLWIAITCFVIGLVISFSYEYMGENQVEIEAHYKKVENY